VSIASAACDGPAHSTEGTEDLGNGQAVLVEFGGLPYLARVQHQNPDRTFRVIYDEDGTCEDVERKRITTDALADSEVATAAERQPQADLPTAGESSAKVSRSAKKRERKQTRDAAYAVANESLQTKTEQINSRPMGTRTCALLELMESTWSVTREGCKDRAELVIPSMCVGWIIGKNGSTIKHIEHTYLVTVQLVLKLCPFYGKRERVKQAMAYIDEVLWA